MSKLIVVELELFTDETVKDRLAITRDVEWKDFLATVKVKLDLEKVKAIYRKNDETRIMSVGDLKNKDVLLVKGLTTEMVTLIQERKAMKAAQQNIRKLRASLLRQEAEAKHEEELNMYSSEYVFPAQVLGLQFEEADNGRNIVISDFHDPDIERLCWNLQRGDLVFEVQGERVLNLPFEEIVDIIRMSGRPLKLRTLSRRLPYARALAWDWEVRQMHAAARHDITDDLFYEGRRFELACHALVDLARSGDVQALSDRFDGTREQRHEGVGASMLHAIKLPRFTPNSKDNYGRTPLHGAVLGGFHSTMKLCVERGGDVNVKDINGSTPLHIAAQLDHSPLAQFLLENGADPNSTDTAGCTPLHIAAERDSLETARVLIRNGADVRAKESQWSWSPLHFTAMAGTPPMARLLLKHGANPHQLSFRGVDCINTARKFSNPAVEAAIQSDLHSRPGLLMLPPPSIPPPAAVTKVIDPTRMDGEASGFSLLDTPGNKSNDISHITSKLMAACREKLRGQIWIGSFACLRTSWVRERVFSAVVSVLQVTVDDVDGFCEDFEWATNEASRESLDELMDDAKQIEASLPAATRTRLAAARARRKRAADADDSSSVATSVATSPMKSPVKSPVKPASSPASSSVVPPRLPETPDKTVGDPPPGGDPAGDGDGGGDGGEGDLVGGGSEGRSGDDRRDGGDDSRDGGGYSGGVGSGAGGSSGGAGVKKSVERAESPVQPVIERPISTLKPRLLPVGIRCPVHAKTDVLWSNLLPMLPRVCRFIRAQMGRPAPTRLVPDLPDGRSRPYSEFETPSPGCRVLILCPSGLQGSVAVLLGFLVSVLELESHEAIAFVEATYPKVGKVPPRYARLLDDLREGLLKRQAERRDQRFHEMRIASVAGSKVALDRRPVPGSSEDGAARSDGDSSGV